MVSHNSIRVIVIDANEEYRKNLVQFINYNEFTVSGSFHNANFIDSHLSNPPDIAIVAFVEIKNAGLNTACWLKEKFPGVRIIINAQSSDKILPEVLSKKGIEGLHYKNGMNHSLLINIMRVVYKGRHYYSKP